MRYLSLLARGLSLRTGAQTMLYLSRDNFSAADQNLPFLRLKIFRINLYQLSMSSSMHLNLYIRANRYIAMFSTIFIIGNNFCNSLFPRKKKPFQKCPTFNRKRLFLEKQNLSLKLTPIENGDKIANTELKELENNHVIEKM